MNKSLLAFLLLFCSSIFASFNSTHEPESSLLSLIENHDSSINFSQSSNRIYLDPARICIEESGIYLKDNQGEKHLLSSLFCDENGLFITYSKDDQNATIYPIIKCKNCNYPFCPTIFNKGICPKCGTQN